MIFLLPNRVKMGIFSHFGQIFVDRISARVYFEPQINKKSKVRWTGGKQWFQSRWKQCSTPALPNQKRQDYPRCPVLLFYPKRGVGSFVTDPCRPGMRPDSPYRRIDRVLVEPVVFLPFFCKRLKGKIESKLRRGIEMRMVKCFAIFIVFSLMTPICLSAAPAEYPSGPIEIIVPYAPGGGADQSLRFYKDRVAKVLGVPIIPVYKPGANAVVGMMAAKKCKPDGYTFMVVANTLITLPPLTKRGNINFEDFDPVCSLTASPVIFCVKEDSPYKTLPELIQAAKTKKMKIKYSSPGVLGAPHIIMAGLAIEAGFEATNIPCSGGAAAMTAVLGGHVDLSVCVPTGMESQLRILACAGTERSSSFPKVPTLTEIGYPGIAYDGIFCLWAPKGTPKEITRKVHAAFRKVLEENKVELAKESEMTGNELVVMGPEEQLERHRKLNVLFKKVIERIGVVK